MPTIDTVVIGAGHAGLAVSRLLVLAGRDHVVLDRGRVAESWRSARWDSLRLLTPNWRTCLPGWRYTGNDADGYMAAAQFVDHLERYAAGFDSPVLPRTTVVELARSGDGYVIVTDGATWRTRNVVIATGPAGRPLVPGAVDGLDPRLQVTTAAEYRNPRQLPDGGVLVVGASASGVQIADELAVSGRDVVLAVGRHTRMPRRYRGRDIYWWLDRTGRLARTIDEVPDREAARHETSMQLIGRHGQGSASQVDLAALQLRGVRLAGRLVGSQGRQVRFADDLSISVQGADERMHRFLDAVDRHIEENGLVSEVRRAERPGAVHTDHSPTGLDLRAERIGTVLLATGYSEHHPWLRLPITAADGSIRQYRGRTAAPGVYVVGQKFQHRRDSAMIGGARYDAEQVVSDLTGARAPMRAGGGLPSVSRLPERAHEPAVGRAS